MYLISSLIKDKEYHPENVKLGLIAIFTSFAGGYMVSDFPKEFLDLLHNPIGQFMVLFCINLLIIGSTDNDGLSLAFFESIISVAILQFIKLILFKIYKKN
jgi:hypothetical protein